MLQKKRLIQLPLVGITLLFLLIGVYLFTNKRSSKSKAESEPSDTVIKHAVDTHPDDALEYWTASKKRGAKATNMPNVDNLDPEKQHPRRPPV
jgi:hypothetical protein